jgi:N-sulfoglucosamine sulfohydrolase
MKKSPTQRLIILMLILFGFSFQHARDSINTRAYESKHNVEKQPLNVLLFTADDLDRNSLACFGSTVPDISPNIDRFAAQSIRFEKAFVNASICVPCRGIIATGLYGNNSGVNGFKKMKEGTTIPLIMEILRSHGYAVGILGKLSHSTPKIDFRWDYQFDQQDLGFGRSPSLYYQRAKNFLDECRQLKKPFYFMVNSHDPHRPFFNPKDSLMRKLETPSRIYSASEIEVPDFLPDLPKVREELSYYYNSTRRLDDTFGKVMQALEESGYADNTLVIFISDNGIAVPFAKANVYYASNRSPFIIRWPAVTKPGSVNRTDIISIIDFLPTVLDALHIPLPKKIDGRSFLSLLKGKRQSGRDKAYMEIDYKAGGGATPMRSIITKRWTYIYNAWADGERVYANNNEGLTMKAMDEAAKIDSLIAARVRVYRVRMPEELYDIQKDPGCIHNLINEPGLKQQVDILRKDLESWMIKTNDPLLNVYRNRHQPAVALKEFYKIYPEAVELDKNKSDYSKSRSARDE